MFHVAEVNEKQFEADEKASFRCHRVSLDVSCCKNIGIRTEQKHNVSICHVTGDIHAYLLLKNCVAQSSTVVFQCVACIVFMSKHEFHISPIFQISFRLKH